MASESHLQRREDSCSHLKGASGVPDDASDTADDPESQSPIPDGCLSQLETSVSLLGAVAGLEPASGVRDSGGVGARVTVGSGCVEVLRPAHSTSGNKKMKHY